MIKIDRFIIIDDDTVNNTVCKLCVRALFDNMDVVEITKAREGLDFIQNHYSESDPVVTVLFLDINMPIVTGWDFLDRFHQFPPTIKEQIKIFMISSSIDQRDYERAHNNPYVIDFIVKPLLVEKVQKIMEQL